MGSDEINEKAKGEDGDMLSLVLEPLLRSAEFPELELRGTRRSRSLPSNKKTPDENAVEFVKELSGLSASVTAPPSLAVPIPLQADAINYLDHTLTVLDTDVSPWIDPAAWIRTDLDHVQRNVEMYVKTDMRVVLCGQKLYPVSELNYLVVSKRL